MTTYPRGGQPPPQRGKTYPPSVPGLPQGYLEKGYFDAKGNLLPEVIQKWPEELAQLLHQEGLTATQLRRFFNRARNLESQSGAGKPFDRLKEEILSLKVLVTAAVGRKVAPELLKQFMDKNVELAIKSPDSFKRGFMTHFQSVVAYVKYLESKQQPKRR